MGNYMKLLLYKSNNVCMHVLQGVHGVLRAAREIVCAPRTTVRHYIYTRIIVCGSHATISKAYVHVVACICLRVVCSSGMLLVHKWELVAVPEWHTLHKR